MPKKKNIKKIYDFSTKAFSLALPSIDKVNKLKEDFSFFEKYDLFSRVIEIILQTNSFNTISDTKPNNREKIEIFSKINQLIQTIIACKNILLQTIVQSGSEVRRSIINETENHEKIIEEEIVIKSKKSKELPRKINKIKKEIKKLNPARDIKKINKLTTEQLILENELAICKNEISKKDYTHKNKDKRLLLSRIKDDLQSNKLTHGTDLQNLTNVAHRFGYLSSDNDRLAYLHKIIENLLPKLPKSKGGRPSSFSFIKVLPYIVKIFKEGTGKKPDCRSNSYSPDGYKGDFFDFLISLNRILKGTDKSLSLGTNSTIGKVTSAYLRPLNNTRKEKTPL